MTHPNTGKEFEPSHHADDDPDGAALGTGKQFASGVQDPQDDEHETLSKGAGKGFATTDQPDADDDTEHGGHGSGKEFRPDREDQ